MYSVKKIGGDKMALPKPQGIQLEVLDLKPIGHNVIGNCGKRENDIGNL